MPVVSKKMRRDWDERAIKSPKPTVYWVPNVDKMTWEELLQTGEDDAKKWIDPFFGRLGVDPASGVALDIGCGWGRLSQALARRFRVVIAVDVSLEMMRQGQKIVEPRPNLHFLLSNGIDLRQFANSSVDFVCTISVFLHIPSQQIILNYLSEIARVLVPRGLCLIQVNQYKQHHLLRRYRLAIRPSQKVPLLHRKLVFYREPSTWHGASIPLDRMLSHLHNHGINVLDVCEAELGRYWIYGQKV